MKHFRLICLIAFCPVLLTAQNAKFPYPILFLHGISCNDTTWNTTIQAFGGSAKIFDVCLNHDGNHTTASLTTDIHVIGWRDGAATPSPTGLYVMNFDNAMFTQTGHQTHTLSNQAAIMKQGVALKAMISAVLSIENTDKVVIVGHSMGGLETREYLQRGFTGNPGSIGTNWVVQSAPSGHSLAKFVTTGTPHLGSNHTGGALTAIFPLIDERSEACRDLRYPYTIGGIPPVNVPAPFIFGGNENQFQWTPTPYNKDVNCNGSANDNITGISAGTSFNPSMPLPANIPYVWILSDYNNLGQDGLVETPRQWLYASSLPAPSTADTIMLTIDHIAEQSDWRSILRGLDEPGDTTFAYAIRSNTPIKGFITHTRNTSIRDTDGYRFKATTSGTLTVTLSGTSSGADTLIIRSATAEITRAAVSGSSTQINIPGISEGLTYFIFVTGLAGPDTYTHSYELNAALTSVSAGEPHPVSNGFALYPNYPNPFNPSTSIRYELGTATHVNLVIYNNLGQKVQTLVNKKQTAGQHTVIWNGKNNQGQSVPSGLYLYRLETGNYVQTKKMILIR